MRGKSVEGVSEDRGWFFDDEGVRLVGLLSLSI